MRTVRYTSRFKKDVKRAKRRNHKMHLLRAAITQLAQDEPLADYMRDHALVGNYRGLRECHLTPDWLLIYRLEDNDLILVRTGSHADLF